MNMQCATRLLAIVRKEVRQLRRDRLTFGMIVGIPLLQIIMFGYAINTDVRHLRAGVADLANSSLSRELVTTAQASQVIDITQYVTSAQQLEDLLRDGKIALGIYIPPDFDRRVQKPARVAAQILVDGSDPVLYGTARQLSALQLHFSTAPTPAAQPGLFEIHNHYNPERRSAVNIVPALAGVILTMTMVLFTAVGIVRERERGNLEMLITTPIKTVELMLGKIIPYILIGLIQVTLIMVLGVLLFRVPLNGRVLDIYIASLIFIGANLTLGLVISTAAKTQFQAMQMTFFFFLPSILLSGFMFPFDGMPKPAQYIAEVLPLTHFVRLIRGVVLRGANVFSLSADIAALLLFASVMLTVALKRFHKRLD
ncbi:MAG: ABC transporter permease [Gammaproteobacteria bacterium]|nr:ABC transporter permease [Gammaproteobacteria bacterium]